MIYNKFKDKQLSALGMGCMRLPTKADYKDIDVEATRQMIAYAMQQGINYYDTAWGYHDGNSELVMGEALADYPRDSFYLASKFPGFNEELMQRVAEIFPKQLEKCRVDYFDFYLFHNVTERNVDGYLDPKYGVFNYLMAQKKAGKIRHLGFSAHGNMNTLKRFLDAYGKDMEFCQLQINWFDWDFQDAKSKVELVSSYGIPIWVMEPVRGGSLATLRADCFERLQAHRPNATAVEWAFRFLQTIPQVVMTLSGMSNFEQLKQNIQTYQTNQPLTDEEMQTILSVSQTLRTKYTLPCTYCRYCTEHCPKGINIPHLIQLYNEHSYSGGGFIAPETVASIDENKRPTACVGCRACEKVCPQNIKISEMMADFSLKMKK